MVFLFTCYDRKRNIFLPRTNARQLHVILCICFSMVWTKMGVQWAWPQHATQCCVTVALSLWLQTTQRVTFVFANCPPPPTTFFFISCSHKSISKPNNQAVIHTLICTAQQQNQSSLSGVGIYGEFRIFSCFVGSIWNVHLCSPEEDWRRTDWSNGCGICKDWSFVFCHLGVHSLQIYVWCVCVCVCVCVWCVDVYTIVNHLPCPSIGKVNDVSLAGGKLSVKSLKLRWTRARKLIKTS